MTSMTLQQEAIAPFVRLLESKGVLHTEKFIGMGFHDDKLYLVKAHARPEQVVVRADDFFFLNKKADGPAFNITNNQTVDDAFKAYRFHGKDGGTSFSDTLAVPQKEMERVMMITALKGSMGEFLTGNKPAEPDLLETSVTSLFQHPDVLNAIQQEHPDMTAGDVDEARDLLNEAFRAVDQQAHKPADAPVEPVVSEQPEAGVTGDLVGEAVVATAVEAATEVEANHRGGIRKTMFEALGWKSATQF